MRLSGMAEYFENLATTTDAATVSGPELVKQAVDWEYERRRDAKLHRLRRHAGLAQPGADIADLKAMPGRAMDTELIARLAIGSYLAKRRTSSCKDTGQGAYVACALGNKACQQYRKVLYLSAGELLDRITIAGHTGNRELPRRPGQGGVVDNRRLVPHPPHPATGPAVAHLIDRRRRTPRRSAPLPPGQWHDRMEEKILADAILTGSPPTHATVLTCEDSMRKHFTQLE